MLASQRPPWVNYHNIIGVLPKGDFLRKLAGVGDGVVPRDSAHLDQVVSELTVEAGIRGNETARGPVGPSMPPAPFFLLRPMEKQ